EGVAINGKGNVDVVDSGNSRVQEFTPQGDYSTQWGTAGKGEGQFSMPAGIAVDGKGDVYVVDWGADRVEKFGP
ncbi:MAG TPA: 6-bladed beta-propeller, partial [bacterium]|nr:6-bladed beta-propeller [bacterium]